MFWGAYGSVTFNAAAMATAASAALPPAFKMERPISVANGCDDAATPCVEYTALRRELKEGNDILEDRNEKTANF